MLLLSLKGERMIHIGGFTPWLFKYVDEKHPGMFLLIRMVSRNNVFVF